MKEEHFPKSWDLREIKKEPRNPEELEDVIKKLTADGCIQAVKLPNGKMDAPPEHVDNIFGGQYFTQIEIIGAGEKGVYFHDGLYRPDDSTKSSCNIFHYENWNYGKEDTQYWQRWHKGN